MQGNKVDWMRYERPLFQASWNWEYCLQTTSERVTAVIYKGTLNFAVNSQSEIWRRQRVAVLYNTPAQRTAAALYSYGTEKEVRVHVKVRKTEGLQDRWKATQSGGEGCAFFFLRRKFHFCQILWVLADLFPALSMNQSQVPCILQVGSMDKHWIPYFFSDTGANTHITTPLKRWQSMSSARSSWFQMAVCPAPSSVKSLLPLALHFNLQFNFTFSWQWHKHRRKYFF